MNGGSGLTDGRSRHHLRSSPSQYPTPRESKEGSRIATPFFPRSREAGEFFCRGNPVTRDRSLQSLIPAFRGAVVREGDNPIRGAIADIVGGGLDAIKSRLLKQPAQATTRIRFGNSLPVLPQLTSYRRNTITRVGRFHMPSCRLDRHFETSPLVNTTNWKSCYCATQVTKTHRVELSHRLCYPRPSPLKREHAGRHKGVRLGRISGFQRPSSGDGAGSDG